MAKHLKMCLNNCFDTFVLHPCEYPLSLAIGNVTYPVSMSFSCGSVWFFHNWYCRHCALRWPHVISPMTCSQPIRRVYACACVTAILSTNSVSQTGGELCGFGTTLRHFTGHIVNAMCEIESACNNAAHVKQSWRITRTFCKPSRVCSTPDWAT